MRIHSSLSRNALGACAALFFAPVSTAQEAVSFEALLRQAQTSSPLLLEGEANVRAAEGLAQQAAAWPNPSLGVEVENFGGSGPAGGSSRDSQTTFSLTEPLEIWGQRATRARAGRADLAAAQARTEQGRAEFAADLALAYANAEAAQLKAEYLSADLERSREDLRRTQVLVEAGREGELRVVQANAAAAAAAADLKGAQADRAQALAHLSVLAGSPDPYARVGASLLTREPVRREGRREPMSAPAIATAQAERAAAEQRLQVQRRTALPALGLSVGVRRFPGEQSSAMVAGVSISLPVFDRNSGAIAAARAEASAAEARLAATHLEAGAGWRAAVALADAADDRVAAASQAEQAAGEAYRLAGIGYEAGRTPLLELLTARRALTDAQLRSVDARLERVRAEAALSRLSGRIPFGDSHE